MKRLFKIILLTVLLLAAYGKAPARDKVYNSNPNPPTDGLVGSNYTPAYAVNQVQFWHDFRTEVVDKELEAARQGEQIAYSSNLRRKAYGWAKDMKPVQPVISCWDDNDETDIVVVPAN